MTKWRRTGVECGKENLELPEEERAMYVAAKCLPVEPRNAKSLVDRDIRDFLAGKTDGEDLLHALYDHVLDEPVPQRLRALFKH